MRDFVALDFETANGKRSSICSVGAVVVKDGEIVDSFYSNKRSKFLVAGSASFMRNCFFLCLLHLLPKGYFISN